MTDRSGSTPDGNTGGGADTSGERSTYTNNTGNNATDKTKAAFKQVTYKEGQ